MNRNPSASHPQDVPNGRRFLRVRDVTIETGASKSKVFLLIKQKKFVAYKLDGLLLIDRQSYERWLTSARPWEPAK